MTKTTLTILLIFMVTSIFSCKNRDKKENQAIRLEQTAKKDSTDTTTQAIDSLLSDLKFNPDSLTSETLFEIKTNVGSMIIKLYDQTPLHKENFIKLASEGFYDSLLFHRVIANFMIQTGDPITKDTSREEEFGTGGPGYTIPAEFVEAYTHKIGALAAARTGDIANPKKNSSGSQFYIVHNANNCMHLNGEYTIFGETVEGLEIIDLIASSQTYYNDRPIDDIRILSIRPI